MLIDILRVCGLHVLLITVCIAAILLSRKLFNYSDNIVRTGIAPAGSWLKDNPRKDTPVSKAFGCYMMACAVGGFILGFVFIIVLLIMDLQMLLEAM